MQIGVPVGRMRRSGTAIYFSAAAALALVAGILVASVIRQAAPTEATYVLARTIPAGTILRADDLAEKMLPPGTLPEGAITSLKAAVGKRLKTALLKGDVVRSGHLAQGTNGYLPERLAEMGGSVRALVLPGEVVPQAAQLAPRDRLELSAVVTPSKGGPAAVPVAAVTVVEVLRSGDGTTQGVLVAVAKDLVPRVVLALRTGSVTAAVAPALPVAAQMAEPNQAELSAAERTALEKELAPHHIMRVDELMTPPPVPPVAVNAAVDKVASTGSGADPIQNDRPTGGPG